MPGQASCNTVKDFLKAFNIMNECPAVAAERLKLKQLPGSSVDADDIHPRAFNMLG